MISFFKKLFGITNTDIDLTVNAEEPVNVQSTPDVTKVKKPRKTPTAKISKDSAKKKPAEAGQEPKRRGRPPKAK
jgi:hypothetical protein